MQSVFCFWGVNLLVQLKFLTREGIIFQTVEQLQFFTGVEFLLFLIYSFSAV